MKLVELTMGPTLNSDAVARLVHSCREATTKAPAVVGKGGLKLFRPQRHHKDPEEIGSFQYMKSDKRCDGELTDR